MIQTNRQHRRRGRELARLDAAVERDERQRHVGRRAFRTRAPISAPAKPNP